ncbi:MAG TPA: FAD:protein FMN transferase [Blastocatellia bacterium]|nr:FAD:protein FMN transferase [Blastocatellia bacterium]
MSVAVNKSPVTALSLCVFVAVAAGSRRQNPQPVLYEETRRAMWTQFEIVAYGPNRAKLAEAADAAFDEIDRLDRQMSNYSETSDLTYINRNAARVPIAAEGELFGLLRRSLDISAQTNGAFDMTVGPLMKAWGFFRHQGRVPDNQELASVMKSVGYSHVSLDEKSRTIRFDRDGVELDLGGIAKGYAVDRAAQILRESGVASALITSGSSSIYAIGAPPGEPGWRVDVRDPLDSSKRLSSIVLKDRSISTSGCSEKTFQLGEKKYCHIMDPRTGRPVDGLLSVTVITATATEADALSTAVMVMGLEKAKAFLKLRVDVGAIIYYRDPDGGLASTRLNY